MQHLLKRTALALLAVHPLAVFTAPLSAQTEVVQAVMFFSPTCPHCAEVIQDHLPIFFGIYGGEPTVYIDESLPEDERCLYLFSNGQLEILLIDASRECGTDLYMASTFAQRIPQQRSGVPRLVMGETVLVGAAEIPSRFHDLMRQAQAAGGLGWPDIPGLGSAVAGLPPRTVAAADSQATGISADVVGHEQADTTVAAQDTTGTADTVRADTVAVPAVDTAAAVDVTTQPVAESLATVMIADTAAAVSNQPPTARVPAAAVPPEHTTEETSDTVVADPDTAVAAAQPPHSETNPFELIPEATPTMLDNLRRDPAGNTVALIVLLGMIVALAMAVGHIPATGTMSQPRPAILLIALVGIAIATYLTYVETSGVTAVCGPVGDCNTVQQSRYATLFGVIPVGLVGLLGYATIVVAWLVWTSKSGLADYAALTMMGIALVGTLFSIYLTFLEPFVIGATCAWCLASSIAITVLLLLTAGGGKGAWQRVVAQDE